MGVSDGRLPIIMLPYGEKRFDGSTTTPLNVVTGTYHNVSFNNYIDGEGLPLLTKLQVIETCDGVYQASHDLVLRQNGSNLTVDGNGYALAPMNYVEFQIPTPGACGGARNMSINLLLKDQNPTGDTSYSQHDLNLSFGVTSWLD
jgi:hypothetical protein